MTEVPRSKVNYGGHQPPYKGLVCHITKIRLVQHNVITIIGKNIFTKVQYPLHTYTT